MENVKVSIFASAVRPGMWDSCLNSFLSTSVPIEVIFGGFCTVKEVKPFLDKYKFFRYLHTKNIKPSQVYEATRRLCTGETTLWFCDDGEVPNDVIGKAYKYWKSQNNEKLILSIQTKESGYNNPKGSLFNMNEHRFFSWVPDSPLMAPLGMMSRKWLEELGGFDRRFICGQYENMCINMAYERGAKVEIFGDADCFIDIDHLTKSIAIGESTNEKDFLNRPFASSYHLDRAVLENSWTTFNPQDVFKSLHSGNRPLTLRKVSPVQLDKFEPYEGIDLLTKSQSNNLKDRWV